VILTPLICWSLMLHATLYVCCRLALLAVLHKHLPLLMPAQC
jgi:hypothetical protein